MPPGKAEMGATQKAFTVLRVADVAQKAAVTHTIHIGSKLWQKNISQTLADVTLIIGKGYGYVLSQILSFFWSIIINTWYFFFLTWPTENIFAVFLKVKLFQFPQFFN